MNKLFHIPPKVHLLGYADIGKPWSGLCHRKRATCGGSAAYIPFLADRLHQRYVAGNLGPISPDCHNEAEHVLSESVGSYNLRHADSLPRQSLWPGLPHHLLQWSLAIPQADVDAACL